MKSSKVYCPESIVLDTQDTFRVYDTYTLKGYEVSPFAYCFLSQCRSPQTVYTLCKKLVIALESAQHARELAVELAPFFKKENDDLKRQKTRLIKSEGLLGLDWIRQSEPLRKLKPFFRLHFIGLLLLFLGAYFLHETVLVASIEPSHSFEYPLRTLLIVSFSTLIHEFGHIMAYRAFGGSYYSFGLGIYFIVPVLFVDLSLSNRMPLQHRLVISLSGVYFELIYVALLLIVDIILFSGELRILAFLVFLQTLWNLNPFFKNDGYWVLSDLFQETWLKKASYFALKQTLLGTSSKASLTLYAFLHLVFYLTFFSWLAYRLYYGYVELAQGFVLLFFSGDLSELTTLHLTLTLILFQVFRSAARLLQWVRLSWRKP